ncbi:MAG: TMEM175 family protein [Ilumatobacteraceae bacterium]
MRYRREGGGISFERVAFFTDAVFAIALTLIVVGIGVPAITDDHSESELWRALGEQRAEFISFAIGVLVIGFYWTSHHATFEDLAAVDRGYVMRTIPYLALVAFLPYPIRLVGTYDANSVAWAVFALNLAAVSSMETVLFAHSWKAGLQAQPLSPAEAHRNVVMSMLPVPFFLVSVPLAFVHPLLTGAAWALTPVAQMFVARHRLPDAADPVSG